MPSPTIYRFPADDWGAYQPFDSGGHYPLVPGTMMCTRVTDKGAPWPQCAYAIFPNVGADGVAYRLKGRMFANNAPAGQSFVVLGLKQVSTPGPWTATAAIIDLLPVTVARTSSPPLPALSPSGTAFDLDVTDIVKEVVAQPGWTPAGNVAFKFVPSNTNNADHGDYIAPDLYLEVTPPTTVVEPGKVPARFATALAKDRLQLLLWVEIEGLPYAYGNRPLPPSFWSTLPLEQRFDALRPNLAETPGGVDARLDPQEGIADPGEFEFQVVDADGVLTEAANVGREACDADTLWLASNVAPGSTTLPVGGTGLANWPPFGIGYIGRTTFSYTGKTTTSLTGVTLGVYRSANAEHKAGESVTLFPQHLGKRRCWYYLALADDAGVFTVDDRVARYAGTIEDYELADAGVWILRVRTPERELSEAMLFRNLRSGRTRTSLPDANGKYSKDGTDDPGVYLSASGRVQLALEEGVSPPRADGTTFDDQEWLYLRVDDEILGVRYSAALGAFETVYRGLFGTRVVPHGPKTDVREVYALTAHDPAGASERLAAKLTAGDRPEEVLLQLLVSGHADTSTPYNASALGTEGAAFDPARVDIAAFEAIRDQFHADMHLCALVDQPVAFREFVVEQLLKPFGLYLKASTNDVLSIGYLRAGVPGMSLPVIDSSAIVAFASGNGAHPRWSSGLDRVVGQYRMEGDVWSSGGGGDERPYTVYVDVFTEPLKLYEQRWQTITHRSSFLHEAFGPGNIPTADGSTKGMRRAFDARRDYLRSRFSKPPPVITVPCLYDQILRDPGDLVVLDLDSIPSLTAAGRGFRGIAEVRSRKIDDRKGIVELELLLVGFQMDRYGRISPSASIVAWNATTRQATLAPAAFSTDGDVNHFEVEDRVVFVAPKLDQVSSVGKVAARDVANGVLTLTFDASPSGVAAGWYLTFADYDALTASQKARAAVSLADASNEALGASRDPAFHYSGA